jgi:AcrR family transcriptional regulator
MRADAQRNYDHIVAVARTVFYEQGTEASLDEIAKRAGVGPGTLYRHFPTREVLIDAVMKSWVDQIQAAADDAATSSAPPRELLLSWFRSFIAHISRQKGGPARLTAAMGNPESHIYGKCQVLKEANARVLDRLRADGALRDDIDSLEVCRLIGGVAAVADQAELDAAATEPLLDIVVDGLLAQGSSSGARGRTRSSAQPAK